MFGLFTEAFKNQNNIATVALILIIIMSIISYNIYNKSNFMNGVRLSCHNTLLNIFGQIPFISKHENITEIDPIKDLDIHIPKIKKKKHVKREKEVFNIDQNDFTYDDASLLCKAYNSELATYDQLLTAHSKDANWCNYGWSANQMALYPIQSDFWNKIQKTDNKDSCGNIGLNGGFFKNKDLKFGVNCYGYKPEPDPAKIIYLDTDTKIKTNTLSNKIDDIETENKYKDVANKHKLNIRPFNNNKWSRYSYKKSTYMIDSIEDNKFVLTEPVTDKDPNRYEASVSEDDITAE